MAKTATVDLQPGIVTEIPLSLIDRDETQPRIDFDEGKIERLSHAFKNGRNIPPIELRPHPEKEGRFMIVDGERRSRAAKLAKKRKIKALLYEGQGNKDDLEKLIDQIAANQGEHLNAIEWANVLKTMHKAHGLKQAEIETKLKESGVAEFGRAYISNMIRLLDLPEWAQDLIRNNAITASHGKYLLQAMASEKVMEELRVKFDDEDYRPTTGELQQDIFWKFQRRHIPLTSPQKTHFDYVAICVNKTHCQKMRKITARFGEETFCLDQECHAILQADAKREKKEQHREQQERDHSGESTPREITFDDDNRVDIDQQQLDFHRDYRYIRQAGFDVNGCEGCKHRHLAADSDVEEEIDSCFLISCYIQKEDEAKRAQRLVEQYLKDAATKKLRFDGESAVRFLVFLAAGMPELITGEEGESLDFYCSPFGNEEEDEAFLFKTGLTTIGGFLDAGQDQLAELGAYAVNASFSNEYLLDLCEALNITIEDYRIDEHYLAEHTEEELNAILEAIAWKGGTFAELSNTQKDRTLDRFIKEHVDVIGVPKEIRFAYEQLTKED